MGSIGEPLLQKDYLCTLKKKNFRVKVYLLIYEKNFSEFCGENGNSDCKMSLP